MKNKIKLVAKIGLYAKGSIYLIAGVLTSMAALNLGGVTSGKFQVLEFLKKQPFGNALILILALGLVCYSIWKITQCLLDPENKGTKAKHLVNRIGYFFSGIFYLSIAVTGLKLVFTYKKSDNTQQVINDLSPTLSTIIFVGIGLVFLGKSLYRFQKVYKGSFLKKFSFEGLKHRKLIINLGYFGYFSRATVLAILAYIFLRAAIYSQIKDLKGSREAFSFINATDYGLVLVTIIALGLSCYGFFSIMLGRYRQFNF